MRPLEEIADAAEDMEPTDFYDRQDALKVLLNEVKTEFTKNSEDYGRMGAAAKKIGIVD